MTGGTPFHTTVSGRRFYEHTMPEVARQLARIAAALEALAEASPDGEPEPPPAAEEPGT